MAKVQSAAEAVVLVNHVTINPEGKTNTELYMRYREVNNNFTNQNGEKLFLSKKSCEIARV